MVSRLTQIIANVCTCVKHVGITAHGQNIGDKIKDGKSVGTDNCCTCVKHVGFISLGYFLWNGKVKIYY